MTTISGAGAHGAVLGTDRLPASKSGNKGYHAISSIKDWVFGQIVDTDTALAANSDLKVPSQKAIKAYVDVLLAANDAMVFKGVIDCSANPNYPAADRGHTYRVSVAGKIGGGSGPNVEVGDLLTCITDSTASGAHGTVGSAWTISQANIDGAVIGPASVTDAHFAQFDGTTGKLLKGGLALDTDTGLVANSDSRIPSQKAIKAYVDAAVSGISGVALLAGANTFTNALNKFTGRVHVDLTTANLAFDEFTSTLASGIKLSSSSNVTVAANKELAGIRWDQTLIIGSAGIAQMISFNLVAHSTSHATSNLYGVIGLLDNAGPGSTKALYGRARALSGSTGVLVAGAFGVNTITGIGSAYGIQIANDTDSTVATNAFIWGCSVTATDTLTQYGILFDDTVSFSQAVLQACQIGAGMFVRIRNSSNSGTVFAIDLNGRVNTAANGWSPATDDGVALGDTTHNWSDLFLASGAVINFASDVTITHASDTLTFNGAASGFIFSQTTYVGTTSNGVSISASAISRTAAAGSLTIAAGTNTGNSIALQTNSTTRISIADASVAFSVNITPNANDNAALGTASLGWSDAFFASGAVLNFNNGGVTITHDAANDWISIGAGDLQIASEKAVRIVGARQYIWQGLVSGDYFRVLVEGVGDALKIYGDGSSVESQFDLKIITGKRLNTIDSQTTVGAAGGATALPATPTGYFKMKVNGTERVVPFYAAA